MDNKGHPGKAVASGRPTQVKNGSTPSGEADLSVKTPARVAIEEAFLNRNDLRRGLTENLKTLHAENNKVSQRVSAAFAKFNLSPVAAKPGGRLNHVPPGASAADVLEAVVKRRITVIEKSDAGAAISVQAHSALISWDQTGETDERTGSVALASLVDFINARRSGSVFASSPTADVLCKAEADAQELLDAVVGTVNGEDADNTLDEDQDGNTASADQLVEHNVMLQMKSATAPEDRLTYGLIPNGANADTAQAGLPRPSSCGRALPTSRRTTISTRSRSRSSMSGPACSTANSNRSDGTSTGSMSG